MSEPAQPTSGGEPYQPYQQPAYQQPAYQQPAYQAPAQQPAYEQPGYGAAPYGQPPQYPGYPQGGYPVTGYAQGGYGYSAPGTNVLAVVSLITSLAAFVVIPVIGSIVAVITGHIAKKQIATSGEQGGGLATAGLVIGYIGLAFVVLGALALIAFAAGGSVSAP